MTYTISSAEPGHNEDGEPTRVDLLQLDIDARLVSLWTEAWEVTEWDNERIAPFLRLAYFMGYRDALTEPLRGTLYRHHGELVPKKEARPTRET